MGVIARGMLLALLLWISGADAAVRTEFMDSAAASATQTALNIRLHNESSTALDKPRLVYAFTAEPYRQPVLETYFLPGGSARLEAGENYHYQLIIEFSDLALAAGATSTTFQLALHYSDWTAWLKSNDYAYDGNLGAWADNDHILVYDQQGTLLSGVADPDPTAGFAAPQPRVWFTQGAPTSTSYSNPQLQIENQGGGPLYDITVEYYFTVEGGRSPVVEDYYTPSSSLQVEAIGNGLYRLEYHFDGVTANPGESFPLSGSNTVGLHYADWSTWIQDDDWSDQGDGATVIDDHIVVRAADGSVLFGTAPDGDAPATDTAPELHVYVQETAGAESNTSKPRIRIQNTGSGSLTGFLLYYYVHTEPGETPVLEDWYTPYAQLRLEPVEENVYRIVEDYSGVTIGPGQTLPNDSGDSFGLHYADWSNWDRSDDPSWVDDSGSFRPAPNIPVYATDGTLLAGTDPYGSVPSADRDGDGVPNDQDLFPDDPTEWADMDGDGIGDNADQDRDGDGVPNSSDAFPDDPSETSDLDGDGIGDNADPDRDGDGVSNALDPFPDDASEWSDLDGDGIGDNADPDRDGDGVPNEQDPFPNDASEWSDIDGDGIGDNSDPDRDGDGVPNGSDAFPDDPTESSDLDGDGLGDNSDDDRDGDGVPNDQDAFPNDPHESSDQDGDGTPDDQDSDQDGDGVPNDQDPFPNDPSESSDIDGDGIGDNSDPDRDGDGLPNASDPDPNVADTQAPKISVGPASQTVEEPQVVLSGSVSDDSGQVASLEARSDRLSGTTFSVVRDAQGQFSVEIPLQEGDNLITFTAVDVTGNIGSASVKVSYVAQTPLQVQISSPQTGITVTASTIDISGAIQAHAAASDIRVILGSAQQTATPTGTADLFQFSFAGYPLASGKNVLTVRVETSYGAAEAGVTVYYDDGTSDDDTPPTLSISSPANGAVVSGDSLVVSGSATDDSGISDVVVQGVEADLTRTSSTRASFSATVDLASLGDGAFTLTTVATDAVGNYVTDTRSVIRDSTAPVLVLSTPDVAEGEVFQTTSSPLTMSGIVTEARLSGISVNGNGVSVLPADQSQSYSFAYALALKSGVATPVTVLAWDQAGRQSQITFTAVLDATVTLEVVAPTDGADLLLTGDGDMLDITARISGQPDTTVLTASMDGKQVNLPISSGVATGELELPQTSGTYTLTVVATDGGTEIARRSVTLTLQQEADIALALTAIDPANEQTLVEPTVPVVAYFNKAVDLTELSVSVRETVHGPAFDENGQTITLDRDNELVPGQLSLLPGSRTAAFYPEREYGYGATLSVEVLYGNETMARTQFQVRPTPTFVSGTVSDPFLVPIAGLKLQLADLGLETTTDADGSFAFGMNLPASQTIASGRHRLIVNPDLANPAYGRIERWVSVDTAADNEVGHIQVPILDASIAYVAIDSGESAVTLGGSSLTLDLSDADLGFSDGNASGRVHTQFMLVNQQPFSVATDLAIPVWLFATQPSGITVQGSVGISIVAPRLNGAVTYLPQPNPDAPDTRQLVVLMGFDNNAKLIKPVGVAEVSGDTISSVGKVQIDVLDYIGIAVVPDSLLPLLQQYAEGEIGLNQLIAGLSR